MKTTKWIPGQKEPGTFDNLQIDAPTFLMVRGKVEPSQPLVISLMRMLQLVPAGIPFDLFDADQRLYHFDGENIVGSSRIMRLMEEMHEEMTRVLTVTSAHVRARTMQEAADQIQKVINAKEEFSGDNLKLQD